MKIHKMLQGTDEWLEIRKGKITGTDVGEFCLEPVAINLTISQIKEILIHSMIEFKSSESKPELIKRLDNPERYLELATPARNLLLKKIGETKNKDPWEIAQVEKEERMFGYNIAVSRGKSLEPAARAYYERRQCVTVTEVGFISSDCGSYGMSPDGLIMAGDKIERGIEIKCPMPETHRQWLLDHAGKNTVPNQHFWQCQMGMVSAECDKWDFLSFCPDEAPLLATLQRSEITDKLGIGLKEMANQKEIIKQRLFDLWDREFTGEKGLSLLTYHNGKPMFDAYGNALDQDGNLFEMEVCEQ